MSEELGADAPGTGAVRRGDPTAPDARDRVLDAAARLLEESGREGLTIRRLARASGLTPPALYAIFGDKAGLLEALVQRTFARLAERVIAIERKDDPRDYARSAYLEIVRFGRAHPHEFRLLEERLPASTEVGPSLEQWRARMPTPLFEGSGPDAPDAELMRQIFWSLLHGLVALPPLRPEIAWSEEVAGRAFDALLEGLLSAQTGGSAA